MRSMTSKICKIFEEYYRNKKFESEQRRTIIKRSIILKLLNKSEEVNDIKNRYENVGVYVKQNRYLYLNFIRYSEK